MAADMDREHKQVKLELTYYYLDAAFANMRAARQELEWMDGLERWYDFADTICEDIDRMAIQFIQAFDVREPR